MVAPSMVPATLDALLFVEGPVILIDRMNRSTGRVAGLVEAEAALLRGEAATYAAQLHPAITGLDIDVADGRLADYLVEELSGWAERRQLWHLARESGGGPGRRHLFVASGRHSDDLVDLVHLLRHERRLTGRELDIRTVIRPLSAPHRQSGRRTPPIVTPAHVSGLSKSLSQHQIGHFEPSRTARRPTAGLREPQPTLLPERARRIIEKFPTTGDRSADEFGISRDLAAAGMDEATTWTAIRSLNGHSAGRGYAWWHSYVWSAIRPLEGHRTPRRVDIRRLILPTFAAIRPSYLESLDTRRRHSLETVGWAILERLTDEPVGAWLPVSERDLQLSTGLGRPTIRAALCWLVEHQVIERRDGDRRDLATSWRVGPRAVWADRSRPTAGQSLIDPPLLTPPASTWAPSSPHGTASAALDLHQQTQPRTSSPRQQELHQAQTEAARQAGLHTGERQRPADPATWHQTLARITAERDQFHGRLREQRHRRQAEWEDQRRQALTKDRDRHRRWWQSLSDEERDRRRQLHQARYRNLNSFDRARLRYQLSQRRRTTALRDPHPIYAPTSSPQAPTGAFLTPSPSPECDSGVMLLLTSPAPSEKISTTHDEKRVIGGRNQTGQGWSGATGMESRGQEEQNGRE